MTKPKRQSVSLSESVLSESTLTVDSESGVIRSVKVIGKHSPSHNREYSETALHQAAKLYEGCKVNIDHPPKSDPARERGLLEGFGELRGVKVKEDGVYADLHYIKSHPSAAVIVESAERFPRQFGLSHNADGAQVKRSGKWIVESVDHVRSVDIVGKPATNAGLFESEAETRTMKLRKLIESFDAKKYLRKAALLEMVDGDPMGEMDVVVADDAPAEDQVKSAFKAMVVAVLDDDSLDLAGKKKKIGEILSAEEKLTQAPEAPSESPSESEESSPAMESVLEELKATRREIAESRTERLLESKGIEATPARIKAYTEATDASVRSELLESWPKQNSGQRRTVTPLRESSDETFELKSPKDVISFLRS